MSDFKLKTPVAFIIFNRPDTTERVFAEIAKAKPPKLLVIGDGARVNRDGEAAKVTTVRAIIDRVDWDCEVLTNYSNVNLGCKIRVSSGIDWVFEQVEEAIILEDDCLPHPSFFRFCEELLERYRDDERIGMISGDNYQFDRIRTRDSYYFSRYMHIWGWATWRRAWKNYDVRINIWPKMRDDDWLKSIIYKKNQRKYWMQIFNAVYEGKIDTWDYQWVLISMTQGFVSITPEINLISNIGFGPDATHTHGFNIYSNMKTKEMIFPLTHPEIFLPNYSADNYVANGQFTTISFFRRLINKILFILGVK